MVELEDCCSTAELDDLKFIGHKFTWTNKAPGDRLIARKLDRVLVNSCWSSIFQYAEAEFLPPGISDHCPMLIRSGIHCPSRKKPFKFINSWVLDPSFDEIVQSKWNTNMEGSLLYQASQKLKLLKSKVKLLNRSSFSDIHSRISAARAGLLST